MPKWACAVCTYLNNEKRTACDMCASAKGGAQPPPEEDDDAELAEALRISAEASNVKLSYADITATKTVSYSSALADAGKPAPLTPNYGAVKQASTVKSDNVAMALEADAEKPALTPNYGAVKQSSTVKVDSVAAPELAKSEEKNVAPQAAPAQAMPAILAAQPTPITQATQTAPASAQTPLATTVAQQTVSIESSAQIAQAPKVATLAPSSTIVAVQPTTIAAVQPSSAIAAVQPNSTIAAVQPSSTIAAVQPSSTIAVQPSSTVAAVQPNSTIATGQPSSTIAAVQPSSTISTVQPSPITVQPTSTPTPSSVAVQPSSTIAAVQPVCIVTTFTVKPESISVPTAQSVQKVASPTVTMKVVEAVKTEPEPKHKELLPPTLDLERNFSTSSWGDEPAGAEDLGDEDWADEETMTVVDPTVALHAAASKELMRDVFELDRLQGYHAGFSMDGDLMRVHVGVSCRALGVSTEQVQVWRMDYSKMIIVTIDFDRMYAASENAPSLKDIKVYQASDTNFFQVWLNSQRQDFGLSWLLQSRLKSTFFRPPYFPVKKWPTRKALTSEEADEFQLYEERLGLGTQVQEVVEATGVEQAVALAALRYCKKDVSVATDLLLDSKKKKAFLALMNGDDEKQSAPSHSTTSSASNLFSMSSIFRSKKAKTDQGGEKTKTQLGAGALVELAEVNFLVRMVSFVTESIVTSGSNCMMCWKNLSFSGFKPTCCDSTLCLFKYRDLGLGVSVLDEIKQAPEVADLLISFAFAATHEHRIEWYFPQNVLAKSSASKGAEDLSFIDHFGKKNPTLLLQVLNMMPAVSEMMHFQQDSAFKEALDSRHKLLYPLLQWLIRSNRSHLRLLTKKEMCPDGPDHQFLLLTSDPTREQFFRDQKKQFEKKNGKGQGSILLTHGSGIGNWHVILRTGLKTSKSGDLDDETKVGLKGTSGICEGGAIGASGGAIWMSMQPGVSMGYTKVGSGWQNSLFSGSIGCMAICEVINDPSKRVLTGSVPGGSHVEGPHEYVCTDVRTIATRYFWVWPSSKPPNCNSSARLGNWDGRSAVGPGTITHLMGFPDSAKAGI